MQNNNLPTTALTNGILVDSRTYSGGLNMDKHHIRNLKEKLGETTSDHLGTISGLMSQIGLNYRDSGASWALGKNGVRNIKTINNSDGLYTYDVVIPNESKAKVMSYEASNTEKPGIDGSLIRIQLNKKICEHNAILSFGPYSGVELHVTDEPIEGSEAAGYWFTCRLITNDTLNRYVDLKYLQPGTYLAAVGSITSERNTLYDSRMVGASTKRYMNYAGNGRAQKYFSVTRDAARTKIGTDAPNKIGLADHKELYTISLFTEGSKVNRSEYANKKLTDSGARDVLTSLYGGNKDAMKQDIYHTVVVPKLEMWYMSLIQKEIDHYSMWGNGGTATVGKDNDRVILPVGLMRQMLNGTNKYAYNVSDFRIKQLEAFIRNGVDKFANTYDMMNVVIKTGSGGLALVKPQIAEHYAQYNVVINGNEFLQNKGMNNNLSLGMDFAYDRISVDQGKFRMIFEYAPELDAVLGDINNIDNPIIMDGKRLSSFAFIVTDITGMDDNIIEVQNEQYKDFEIMWESGKMDYMDGGSKRHAINSINNPGYTVYMEKGYRCYHLVDQDKCWMMLPINPKTGQKFASFATNLNS
jgi:hypothetical protein